MALRFQPLHIRAASTSPGLEITGGYPNFSIRKDTATSPPAAGCCVQKSWEGRKGLMDFFILPICLSDYRNHLTPGADTPMMSVAPAAAFPTYEVPLIRMPE
jgi:hypothetical protein